MAAVDECAQSDRSACFPVKDLEERGYLILCGAEREIMLRPT